MQFIANIAFFLNNFKNNFKSRKFYEKNPKISNKKLSFPSQIAAASLYLALHIFNTMKSDKDVWTPTLEHYTTYESKDLMPIMKRLASIVCSAKDVKLKSVYNKYSNSLFKFTAQQSEMTGLKIQEIINRD